MVIRFDPFAILIERGPIAGYGSGGTRYGTRVRDPDGSSIAFISYEGRP